MSLKVANLPKIRGNLHYLKVNKAPESDLFTDYFDEIQKISIKDSKQTETIRERVKIDWEISEISGYVTLTGLFNVCIWEGLYYLLERVKSYGGNRHLYKVSRWFWVNDVLNNPALVVKGTINRTTDKQFIQDNINHTTPTISAGNSIIHFPVSTLPAPESSIISNTNFLRSKSSHFLYYDFDDLHEIGDVPKPSFWLPNPALNWKGWLLKRLQDYIKDNELEIYDLNTQKDQITYNSLNKTYPANSGKFYTITRKDRTEVDYGKTKNNTKKISQIDLSNVSDVIKLTHEIKNDTVKTKKIKELPQSIRLSKKGLFLKGVKLEKVNKEFKYGLTDIKKAGEFHKESRTVTFLIGETETEQGKKEYYYNLTTTQGQRIFDLNKTKLIYEDLREELKYFDDFHKNFLISEEINQDVFINVGVATFNEANYYIEFKKIPLMPNTTEQGRNFIPILVMTPLMKRVSSGTGGVYIANSGKLEDKTLFTLSYHSFYYPDNWTPHPSGEYVKEVGGKIFKGDVLNNACKFSKSEFKEVLKGLIERWHFNSVGSTFSGMLFQFPKGVEDTDDMGKPWNPFSNFVLDSMAPVLFNQYIYLAYRWNNQPGGFNLKDWSNNFELTKKYLNKLEENGVPLTDFGKYVDYEEAISLFKKWFDYWSGVGDGDFYIRDRLVECKFSEGVKFTALEVFKLHNGREYKFCLLFRRWPKKDIADNQINFRYIQWHSRYAYRLSFYISPGTEVGLIWYLIWILSFIDGFPVGTWEDNLENGILGRTNAANDPIHWFERYQHINFKVNDVWSELKFVEIDKGDTQNLINVKNGVYPGDHLFYVSNDVIEWEEEGLFDLKDSNFLVYAKGIDFELIPKTNNLTLINASTLNKNIVVSESRKNLAQIINSNNTLTVYGTEFPIKWRGTLLGEVRFQRFELTPLELKEIDTPYECYRLILKTEVDAIDTIIQIMKEKTAITGNISIAEYEDMSYRISQEMKLNSLNIQESRLQNQRWKESMYNQWEDLNADRTNKILSATMGSVLSVASTVMAPFTGAFGAAQAVSGLGGLGQNLISNNIDTVNSLYKANRDYELARRLGGQQESLKLDRDNINFDLADRAAKLRLSQLSSNIVTNSFNESSIHRALVKSGAFDDIYLTNVSPTGSQLDFLENYYKEFGYDINASGYTLTNANLNPGYVVQFQLIESIEGVDNPEVFNAVKTIFESGCKIEE